jgi:hypothetical protein
MTFSALMAEIVAIQTVAMASISTRADLVHALEIGQVDEEDGCLDDPVEPATGGLEDRPQVRENLLGLLLDRARVDLVRARLHRDLAGDEDETPRSNRL